MTRVTEVLPGPADPARADAGAFAIDAYGEPLRAWLAARYSPADGVRVRMNMITSLTGAAVGADGTSDSLTSRVDRTLLGVIRSFADVVLVGAATVRAEGAVLPRRGAFAIVTATGDLGAMRMPPADAARVLLVCPAAAADDVARRAPAGAEVVPVPGDAAPREILGAVRDRGLARVVCEGGPSLSSAFARAGVVDEYCVTVAPAIGARGAPFVDVDDTVPTHVAGMLVDDAGFSYLRLRPRAATNP